MKSTELTAEESTNEFDGNGFAPLIRLAGVTKVFLTDEVETHALSGIHLDIREGEYCSIAGPSGCGKTTLLSILGLLDTPSDGSYALKGHEVANLSFAERATTMVVARAKLVARPNHNAGMTRAGNITEPLLRVVVFICFKNSFSLSFVRHDERFILRWIPSFSRRLSKCIFSVAGPDCRRAVRRDERESHDEIRVC